MLFKIFSNGEGSSGLQELGLEYQVRLRHRPHVRCHAFVGFAEVLGEALLDGLRGHAHIAPPIVGVCDEVHRMSAGSGRPHRPCQHSRKSHREQ